MVRKYIYAAILFILIVVVSLSYRPPESNHRRKLYAAFLSIDKHAIIVDYYCKQMGFLPKSMNEIMVYYKSEFDKYDKKRYKIHRFPKHPYLDESSYLHYSAISESQALIYSVGPDKIDNGGIIVYDPSNGIISRGDIVYIYNIEEGHDRIDQVFPPYISGHEPSRLKRVE